MRPLGTAALALLLALTLAVDSAGVANGFSVDATVHCCCGDHPASEDCGCPACPGVGRLRWRSPAAAHPPPDARHDDAPARHATVHGCHGKSPRGALASFDVLLPAPDAPLPVTEGVALLSLPPPLPLADRLVGAPRPPP